MEQILIRNLPGGTKAALRVRAEKNHRSIEAEVRQILTDELLHPEPTLPELLAMGDDDGLEFDPPRLGLTARIPDL